MNKSTQRRAIFAGGCFWCMEPPFAKLDGVLRVLSGYIGGESENPSYEEVFSGRSGHLEAVAVDYDPDLVSYEQLLEVFWHNINPTDEGGQFADRGSQYRSAIFYHDAQQQRLAEASKRALAESGRFEAPIATQIIPAAPFYPAEDYHQGYAQSNPLRYSLYRHGSGRDRFLERFWSDKPQDKS